MGLAALKKTAKGFNALLLDAVEVEREIRGIEKGGMRLTREAFIEEALKNAGATRHEVEEARKKIFERAGDFPKTHGFLNRLETHLLPNCGMPPKDLVRFRGYGLTEALEEVGSWASAHLLLAVAVLRFSDKNPVSFGQCTDYQRASSRLKELQAKRASLFSEIERGYGAEDLLIEPIHNGGLAKVSLKFSGGEVSLGPIHSLGERTCAWLMAHPESVAALEKGGR